MRIVKSSQIRANHVNMLVYGQSGAGKTSLAATCPRPLIVSVEQTGQLSLNSRNLEKIWGPKKQAICYDVPIMFLQNPSAIDPEFPNNKNKDTAYGFLQSAEASSEYDTVVIDSLSEIADLALIEAKKHVNDGRQAYLQVQEFIGDMIRRWCQLPYHILMICKLDRIRNEVDKEEVLGPLLTGQKLGAQVPYMFNVVMMLKLVTLDGSTKRIIQTHGDAQHTAKDASGMLNQFEAPHIGVLLNKMDQSPRKGNE